MRGSELGLSGIFAEAEVISVYTREQAIEDGALVDISEKAAKEGFRLPTVVTQNFHLDLLRGNGSDPATYDARLSDVFAVMRFAARAKPDTDRLSFKVKIGARIVKVWAVIDGDGLTIGRPEDF